MIKNAKEAKVCIQDLSQIMFVPGISFCFSLPTLCSPANFRELLLESFLVGTLDLPKEAALTLSAISRVLGPGCATVVLLLPNGR